MLSRVSKLLFDRRIPYGLSRRLSRNPDKALLWRMARHLYSDPASFYRVAGCFPLPVQTASYRDYPYEELAPVEPHPASDIPLCPDAANEWQRWTSDLDESLCDPGIPSCHVVTIPGGFADASGNVFSREGRLVIGASLSARKDVNAYYVPTKIHPPVYVCTSAAAVTSSQQNNYFHWLMDVLPRLHLLRSSGRLPEQIYIQNSKPYQRETLKLLGIEERRIIDPNRYELVRAEELVVPFHEMRSGMRYPDWVVRFLREGILSRVPKERRPESPKRLYLSRKGMQWRNVLNEAEVLKTLEPLGFQSVTLEGLSVLEQAALFAGAEMVVAPHGAALANLVFASPGTKVVEILPRKLQDAYFLLSRAVGLSYYYIQSRTGPERPVNNRQQLTVDAADLTRALAWMELA